MTLDRRDFLAACSRAGITSALLPGILYTLASQTAEAQEQLVKGPSAKIPAWDKVTPEMLDQAAQLAGVGPFTAEQKKMMLEGLTRQRDGYAKIRELKLPNSVAPAFVFHPQPAAGARLPFATESGDRVSRSSLWKPRTAEAAPARLEDLAFATVTELAGLLREYKRFMEVVALLEERQQAGLRLYSRMAPPLEPKPGNGLGSITLEKLCALMVEMLSRTPPEPRAVLPPERGMALSDRIADFRTRLLGGRSFSFRRAIAECRTRLEVVVSFMAILELIRAGEADATQPTAWGDIEVVAVGDAAETRQQLSNI
jgi:hypothetical protein